MNKIIMFSALAFLFLTYQFLKLYRTKEFAKNNKALAWTIYAVVLIGAIAAIAAVF